MNHCPPKKDPQYFRNIVFSVCPSFVINDNNRQILNDLYDYAHGEGRYNYKKGIFFYGEVGTGKSTMMKILAEYQRLFGHGFKCVNCSSLTASFATYGIDELNESTWNEYGTRRKPVERGFDELGRETLPARYFGNELNVMQHVLQLRYDLKVKTHITTNLKIEEIEHRYGAHIYDRCIEMFNFIEVKGESFRQ